MITIEREKLERAIKAMLNSNSTSYEILNAADALNEALAQPNYRAVKTYHEGKPVYVSQPEQEPWMYRIWNDKDAQWRLTDDCSWPAEPIYTTPPKRPWVGLTDEQREECTQSPFTEDNYEDIEDKLKELNT
jgi:hypothetical protein